MRWCFGYDDHAPPKRETMRRIFLLSFLVSVTACSSDNEPADTGGLIRTDSGPAAPDAGSVPDYGFNDGGGIQDFGFRDMGGGPPDTGLDLTRDPSCPSTAEWIVTVNGTITDPAGNPLPAGLGQVCARVAPGGMLICLRPEEANANGQFSIVVPDSARCVDEITMRVIEPGTNRSTMYCHVDLPAGGNELVVPDPLVLYPTTPAVSLPPPGDINASRTVAFADGLELDVVPFDFFSEYSELAAAKVDVNTPGLCFLKDTPAFESLYAFSPEGAIDGTGFDARIPNSTNLAPGTQVGIYILGGLGCKTPSGAEIPEAEWRQTGTGTVDGSGQMIVTAALQGVTCLTWLGVRQ